MTKQRFILIAWPEDHDEDLEQHACDIADALVDMGCPEVIAPLSETLTRFLDQLEGVSYEGSKP